MQKSQKKRVITESRFIPLGSSLIRLYKGKIAEEIKTILKDCCESLMEEKRLNLDAPLMSMRRCVSPYDNNGKTLVNRQLTLSYYSSEKGSESVTGQITVPFVWEQTPGRPKVKKGFESQVPVEEAHVILTLPPGRNKPQICSFDEQNTRFEGMEADRNEKGGSDDDDVYSDALDTLSPTNLSSVSCSISGFNGCDDDQQTFSTDEQTREYMMKRFLPASMAVSLDPPSYASKKQLVIMEPEKQKERKNIVSVVDRKDEESESESENEVDDDEYEYNDDIANMSKKGCGLLPHVSFKNSLLNQVSGLKVRATRNSMSSSIAAHIESHLQTVKKHVRDSFIKRKTERGFRSLKLLKYENNRGKNRVVYNSLDQLTTTTSSSSSPSRHPPGGRISPYRNAASRSPIREVGFLGTPKNAVRYSFKEGTHQLLIPPGVAVEKTMYVNTLNFRETSSSDSSSSWMGTSGEAFGTSSGIRVIEESDDRPVRDVDEQYNSLKCIKFTGDEDVDTSTDWRFLLSPPSESWLSRTMPTHVTSSGNAFSKPSVSSTQFNPKTHDLRPTSSVSNWETIVKTSCEYHDHVRYSKEIDTHVCHQSET